MLILNTLTIILQISIVGLVSIVSMNIVKQFTSGFRKMAVIAPALFVNHGGGPMPLLGDKDHLPLTNFLRDEVKKHVNLKEIKAIILVTAHWEEDVVTISSGDRHNLLFDYYGFPPESYKYRYDAPGDPELASRIQETLKSNGIKAKLDPKRGWDHGVFVPMILINPDANIPIVQVSVMRNQDAQAHYEVGQALNQFRKEGIAILGSGMSYHNMRELMYGRNSINLRNKDFDDYLTKVCTSESEEERKHGLEAWRQRSDSFEAHPDHAAEHFMPLIVIAGAGGPKKGERIFNWDMGGSFRLSSYIWKE